MVEGGMSLSYVGMVIHPDPSECRIFQKLFGQLHRVLNIVADAFCYERAQLLNCALILILLSCIHLEIAV